MTISGTKDAIAACVEEVAARIVEVMWCCLLLVSFFLYVIDIFYAIISIYVF